MRRHLALTALTCALLASSAAHAQRQRGDESWGKTGVSYLQYRTDAVECAYRVGQDAPVEYALVDINFPIEMANPDAGADLNSYTLALASAYDPNKARMSRPYRMISSQLQEPLAKCLGERGYRRFRLTKDQTKELRSLSPGSKARQVYLWNLAVDPQVQQRQTARR